MWMQRVLDDGVEASERYRRIAKFEVVAVDTWRRPNHAAIEPLTEAADFYHREGDRLTEAQGPH